jgi:hypothetical protein
MGVDAPKWSYRSAAGVFYNGRIVGRCGRNLDWLDDWTRVELWHPISETADEVLAWRDWLAEMEIQQPFKQAHREVYLLTGAEQTTTVYSNSFAAHIIKQHQFNALCGARGWKSKLIILSEALLLAEDRKIKDPTILHQICG